MRNVFACLVLVVAALALSGTALAQSEPSGPNSTATAADYAQLPLSIGLRTANPAGWSGGNDIWFTAIWPRNASGAWYRNPQWPSTNRPGSISLSKYNHMSTSSYNCFVHSPFVFRCRDNVRGIDRYYECPATVMFNSVPYQWRSQFHHWPNHLVGYFTWDTGASSRWLVRTDYHVMPRQYYSVSTDQKSIYCSYRAPDVIDVWLYKR